MPTMIDITSQTLLKLCREIGVQLLLIPDLYLYPELFRRLVELDTISAAIGRVELLLSVRNPERASNSGRCA